jgi:hypothetical protein
MGVERRKRKGREVKENSDLYNHEMFHDLETHESELFFHSFPQRRVFYTF